MNNTDIVDFVVTWVDNTDPKWLEKKAKYTGCTYSEENPEARYRDWDTLKYWFRGVEKFAPWVRYVWFVTDDQKPEWLNVDHPKLKWVRHTDYIPEEYLPTFQSHPIEWNLHRIEGLAEQFVYFNDDMFLIRQTQPMDFFVDGLPCDLPQTDYIYPASVFSHILFNNANLLNRHFSLRESAARDWKKWFLRQSPKGFLKNVFFCRKDLIPGFVHEHVHISFLKSTFHVLWEKEYDCIHETCTHKQRTRLDVSDWCVRNWQLLEGKFYPKKLCGKSFSTHDHETNGALTYMQKQKGKVICLNDNEREKDYAVHREQVIAAFEKLLPEKSAFEL